MQKTFSSLLEQDMDRKNFLRHVGAGLVMLMGGGLIAHAITQAGSDKTKVSSTGYGGSTYGRVKGS